MVLEWAVRDEWLAKRALDHISPHSQKVPMDDTDLDAQKRRDRLPNEKCPFTSEQARERMMHAAEKLASIEASMSGSGQQQAKSKLGAAHERGAQRLLVLCEKNRALYLKLSQHLSMLDFILPREYCTTLRKTLDQTPTSRPEDVRRIIIEELGVSSSTSMHALTCTCMHEHACQHVCLDTPECLGRL